VAGFTRLPATGRVLTSNDQCCAAIRSLLAFAESGITPEIVHKIDPI